MNSPKKVVSPKVLKNTEAANNYDIVSAMCSKISDLEGLQKYPIRELVEDSEKLGRELAKGLKTNQIRKFLDSVNQLKVKLGIKQALPGEIADDIQLLRPKLAYAAARQIKNKNDPGPVEPFKQVLDIAIQRIRREPEYFQGDFTRFTQLVESIIAYHKASGGKDQ